jgi:branched-chain amino acid transport system ATP-binding protein
MDETGKLLKSSAESMGHATANDAACPPGYSARGHRADRPHILEVRDLVIAYGEVVVVRNLSIHIHEGEFVALVGPNGAGKTTTLRTIQGLIRPRQGEVWLAGTRIDHLPPHERVARGLISIPEGRRLFPEMTVRENLEMGAYTRRARAVLSESLEMVYSLFPSLKDREHDQAGKLSGGQQQILAIGRGLMARPHVLLLDDPLRGLDRRVTARFCEAMQNINDGGLTILVSGQHVRRLLNLARRAYLLEAGQITMEGPGPALLASERLRLALLTGSGEEVSRL